MREKLIELLCKAHNAVTDKSLENDSEFGMTYAEQIETEADSLISNGVTIPVRCEDCKKRYKPNECPMCILVYGEQHDFTQENGYCDRGERRTDGRS